MIKGSRCKICNKAMNICDLQSTEIGLGLICINTSKCKDRVLKNKQQIEKYKDVL